MNLEILFVRIENLKILIRWETSQYDVMLPVGVPSLHQKSRGHRINNLINYLTQHNNDKNNLQNQSNRLDP